MQAGTSWGKVWGGGEGPGAWNGSSLPTRSGVVQHLTNGLVLPARTGSRSARGLQEVTYTRVRACLRLHRQACVPIHDHILYRHEGVSAPASSIGSLGVLPWGGVPQAGRSVR